MENWYWYVILAVFVVLTVFVMKKASDASKKHQRAQEQLKARLIHEAELKRDFSQLTLEKINSADPARLGEGAAANIQFYLEKYSDMESRFLLLSEPQKYIYVFHYLCEDSLGEGKSLCDFFMINGKPLTPLAYDAVLAVTGSVGLADAVKKAYDMSDEDNEEVSSTDEAKARVNAEFAAAAEGLDLNLLAGEYVRKNAESFLSFGTED